MTAPGSLEVLALMRLEDGSRWGERAAGFQIDDAAAIASDTGPRSHYVTRPRGGSKTTDLAGLLVAFLVCGIFRGSAVTWAVDQDQARLLLHAARGLVERTPELRGLVLFEASRMASAEFGGEARFMPADGGGSFGLRAEMVVLDELAAWPETPTHRQVYEAALSTRAKVDGCRLVVITTAGAPSHFSRQLLEHARASELWRTAETPGPLPWINEAELEDQRQLLPESAFARLHLNQWTEPDDALVSAGDLDALVQHDHPRPPQAGVRYSVGLDIGTRRDRTAAVVASLASGPSWSAGKFDPSLLPELDRMAWYRGDRVRIEQAWRASRVRNDPRVFRIDRVEVWKPSKLQPVRLTEVAPVIHRLAKEHGDALVHYDPYQAVLLAEALEAAGVRTKAFTFSASSVGRLGHTMFSLLSERRLLLPDHDDLLAELRAVRLVERQPGTYRLDHPAGGHDDITVAAALALLPLVEQRPLTLQIRNYRNNSRTPTPTRRFA